jgi:hypothetical protein
MMWKVVGTSPITKQATAANFLLVSNIPKVTSVNPQPEITSLEAHTIGQHPSAGVHGSIGRPLCSMVRVLPRPWGMTSSTYQRVLQSHDNKGYTFVNMASFRISIGRYHGPY